MHRKKPGKTNKNTEKSGINRKNPVKQTKISKKFGFKPKYRKNSALNQNTEKSGKTENFTDFLICLFYFQYYI